MASIRGAGLLSFALETCLVLLVAEILFGAWSRKSANPYQYAPLAPDEIRTLVIQPGTSDGPVLGAIEHHKITAPGKAYEALSYVWGSTKRNRLLQVGDQHVQVTRNAEALLRRLRHPQHPRRIWIDGICINQDDASERAHQVSLMHSIFSNATSVLVWVGESDAHTEDVFRFFTLVDQRHHSRQPKDKETGREGLEEHERDNFSRICAFVTRPWFRRAWTFQEACLSPETQLLCGHHKLDWRIFISAALWLTSSGLSSVFGETADTIVALVHFAAANPSHQTAHLSTVLPLTRNLQATDPRDKVFSFLGMIDRTNLPPLNPSYTVPVSEIYTRTARAMIAQEQGLSVLSGVHGPHQKDRALPSWVPDWRLPRVTAYLHGFDWPSPTHLYHINKGAPFPNSVHSDLESSPGILRLKGAEIDTIERIYNPKPLLSHVAKLPLQGPDPASSETLVEAWQHGLEKILDRMTRVLARGYSLVPYHQTEEDFATVLMRTVTADRGGVGEERMGEWRTVMSQGSSLVTPNCMWWSEGLRGEEAGGETDASLAMKRLASAMWTFLLKRVVFVTKGGLVGIGGEKIKAGDEVWNIIGGEVPFVLSAASSTAKHNAETKQRVVVGEAYVHGIMKGGLWDADLETKQPKRISSRTIHHPYPRRKLSGKELDFQDVGLI